MKAFVVDSTGKAGCVDQHRAVPSLQPNQVLVKPVAVALNPTDWRHLAYERAKPGCIVGCDYAGVVVSAGAEARDTAGNPWKEGDKIFGCAHGSNLVNPDDGVFTEYAVVTGDIQMRLSEATEKSIRFEGAATLGLGAITVGQGLFQKSLKLELPDPSTAANPPSRDTPVLIYGGSTATGALGIQYARRAGYTVITTCSPANVAYVKSLGADYAVDYHSPDAGQQIREYTGNRLYHAFDTVSVAQSAHICADALSTNVQPKTPVYGSLLPVKFPRSDVQSTYTVMHTVFGKAFQFGQTEMPASAEDFAFGRKFFALTQALVEKGLIKPHTYRVEFGGLDGIATGLANLQKGAVKAEKLVYRLADTA
ncbi:hypothetical protein SEUCBS140593_006350 [Sporothrix eucalyptigena]|uniref:Enoyl reductase (ER) domain-containing protein n=1 Tax=Sporothrix eucalyptigena TaxID=1812306 RepID=A0ABP0C469_9PEZI